MPKEYSVYVCVRVYVGPMWWAAGCKLNRPLAGLELSGQEEKDEQVGAKKASFNFTFYIYYCRAGFIVDAYTWW